MGLKKLERLAPEIEEQIFEAIADGQFRRNVCAKFGFKTRYAFGVYLAKFPDFEIELDRAYRIHAIDLEEQLLTIPLEHDPRTADVLSKNILNILKFRDRKRYGDKTEIEINQTVDITVALDAAMARLIDVTPTNVLSLPTTKKIP